MFEEITFLAKMFPNVELKLEAKNRKHQIELMQWHYFLKYETILGFQHFFSLTIQ